MAKSPSHKLGELIGDFFEDSIIQYLKPIVSKAGFYLDYRHERKARGGGKEVLGVDKEGNRHKLDIVIEEGGSEEELGNPKAFIEMAWRRYTKHSKAKVQEISGAILPLVKTYRHLRPFYAAVLAGEFTKNSITQLESQGFYVLHFSYKEICDLYSTIGVSINWEESTPDKEIEKIATQITKLTPTQYKELQSIFFKKHKDALNTLAKTVIEALNQEIVQIIVVPIHGKPQVLATVDDAVDYIRSYDEKSKAPILRYEIAVRYSDGDEYTMKCKNKLKAIQYLNQYK